MQTEKGKNLRNKILHLIRRSRHLGISQRDIELTLDISKSYCSEVVTSLEKEGKVIRRRGEGRDVRFYVPDFFPGSIHGLVRVGMLKSSEYIPIMGSILEQFGEEKTRVKFRFYNGVLDLLNDFGGRALDLCLAPTTALTFSAIIRGDIKILTGTASGGSGVIQQDDPERDNILSTETSSMIALALKSKIPEAFSTVETYDDPDDGMKRFSAERFGKIAIWEPYFSHILKDPGYSVFVSYSDVLDDFPCCSLAAGAVFFEGNRGALLKLVEKYRDFGGAGKAGNQALSNATKLVARATKFEAEFLSSTLASYNFTSTRIDRRQLPILGITISERQAEEIFLSGTLV